MISSALALSLAVSLSLHGCGPAEMMDPMSSPQVEARVSLESKIVPPDVPAAFTTTLITADGWSGALPAPAVEGLTFELADEVSRRDSDRSVLIRHYAVSGEPGSYVIPSLSVSFSGPGDQQRELETATLFLDLGVEGPTSDLSELVMAPVPEPARWPYAAGALAAGMLLGGLIVLGLRGRGRRAAAIVLPPHEQLMREWALVRDDDGLDDEARATALSALFRVYLEASTGVEATSLTTAEVTAAFRERGAFAAIEADSLLILMATDRVKYAGEGGGDEVFAELDGAVGRVVKAELERAALEARADDL